MIKDWEATSSTGSHFALLDGIRGLAILMVVSFHTFYTNPDSGQFMRLIGSLFNAGWLGVPVFFVLSGFLLSYPFFRARESETLSWYPKNYGRRRFGKIAPPYYLSLLIFSLFYLIHYKDIEYLFVALQYAVGLPNFIPVKRLFNASYWSLLVEIQFYLILPFLFFLTRRLKLKATFILLFLVLFVGPMVARYLVWPDSYVSKGEIEFLLSRFPCQMDYFFWGILFAGIYTRTQKNRTSLLFSKLLGLAGVILFFSLIILSAFFNNIGKSPSSILVEVYHFLAGISVFMVLFYILHPTDLIPRILAWPWLRFIGLVSYEWFLFHQPVVYIARSIFGNTEGSFVLYAMKTILPLALTFAFSVLVYRYFSLPLMRIFRNSIPTVSIK